MNPVVSICCVTYNHARFIGEALDGFLMQRTAFPLEIIIHDDCSTDGTADIIREYRDRHPDLINAIFQTENQFAKGTKIYPTYVWPKARGKYIAMCEGDDYWIDPLKLQKQVDFLEAHPECSLCYHNVERFFQDNTREPDLLVPTDRKAHLSIKDIVLQNPIPTPSVMYRNGLLGEFPAWYYDLPMGDWPLWVLLAQHGQAGYINETMAAYRVHSGGVHSGTPLLDWLPRMRQAHDAIDRGLGYKYHDIVEQGKNNYLLEAAEALCPRSFVNESPRKAEQALQGLRQYAEGNPELMLRLRGRFYAACFFRAAELGDYRAVRQSLVGLALYGRPWFQNHGVCSITARALIGRRFSEWFRTFTRGGAARFPPAKQNTGSSTR
jgi:glycosyltransferase involved in cell wall biosynthesis